jgi:hypothetical protein
MGLRHCDGRISASQAHTACALRHLLLTVDLYGRDVTDIQQTIDLGPVGPFNVEHSVLRQLLHEFRMYSPLTCQKHSAGTQHGSVNLSITTRSHSYQERQYRLSQQSGWNYNAK